MTMMQALILALVEGVTEYLPISSTGHIIITSWLMGIHHDPFVKDYTVMVQFGAILAVVVLYWKKFVLNTRLYPAVLVAFLPAAVVGLSAKKYVDVLLDKVAVVGAALLIGGVVLVWTDAWIRRRKPTVTAPEDLQLASALKVGLIQLLAFIPGVSRSAASILGGLHQGMSLMAATEFSFFLAAPTLAGASVIKLIKVYPVLDGEMMRMILWGNLVSFVVGAAAIRTFVKGIGRFGLKSFGYYRIVAGMLVLAVAYFQN